MHGNGGNQQRWKDNYECFAAVSEKLIHDRRCCPEKQFGYKSARFAVVGSDAADGIE
jgi:hypothetical protein